MNFLYQTGPKDCFPTCFSNAMLHLGIEIKPVLVKRLAIFKNGVESCTIYDTEERLEIYERSIHKFIAEWNWALRHKHETGCGVLEPEEWAKYLLEIGVDLEARNGPIEQKKVLIDALSKKKIAICEIWIPSADIPDSECKHDVLIVGIADAKLLIHDPLQENENIQLDSDNIKYTKHECGSNLKIECDYFFSEEINWA